MNVVGDRNDGFTVLDGAAMVFAAASASLHMRGAARDVHGIGWLLVWLTFAGIAITSGGTFVYLFRRFGRRPSGYPRIGDKLWALLGLPWIMASPFRSPSRIDAGLDFYGFLLTLTVGVGCLVVLSALWKTFVMTRPETAENTSFSPLWSDRLGMALAIAWPLQCGFLLIVLDSEPLPPIVIGH